MSVTEPPEGINVIELNLGSANAINYKFLNTLNGKLEVLEKSDKYRAAVITGYDRFFSAGLDLVKLFELDRSGMKTFMGNFKTTFMRLFTCTKPVVAAINGHAVAGGCVMALACDYRIMGRGSSLIGLNEVKLGIGVPTMVVEFARAVLPQRSWPSVLLMGEMFPPQKALATHLIDELVEPTNVLRRSIEMAAELATGRDAFSQIKRDLRAPIVERLKSKDNSVEWLDLWFSVETREEVAAIRRKLINRHSQRVAEEEQAARQASEPEAVTGATAEESVEESVHDHQEERQIIIEEPTEILERVSDEEVGNAAAE